MPEPSTPAPIKRMAQTLEYISILGAFYCEPETNQMIKEESSISIKVGDLVYLLGDELGMFGYGLVLEKRYDGEDWWNVYWFDDRAIDVELSVGLVVVSSSE